MANPMINKTLITLIFSFSLISCFHPTFAQWITHGRDITNRRQFVGGPINPTSVTSGRLRLKWKFLAGFDISATPSVAVDGVVYVPSWNGNLYAVNAFTGALKWARNLGQLTGLPPPTGQSVNVTVSRSTPVVAPGGLLIVGIYGPAYVIAMKRATGDLVWSTRVDPGPLSVVTASGTPFNGGYFVGVSSLEELLPAGQCCTFRGSMVKMDIKTGRINWQTYTLPDNGGRLGGYSGAAIWGSSPSIDIARRLVYVGTGNLYLAPQEVLDCQARQNNQTTPPAHPDLCIGPDVHFDSLMAFDINRGTIVWAKRFASYDVFYFACLIPNNPDCPPGPNIDADFGEAPMQLTIFSNKRLRDVIVAVQKSGFAWALDRSNGDIVWFTKAGPGSTQGGGVWGAATDGARVYTNIANGDRLPFTLKPSSQTTNAGGWVAMDANTGRIIWTTANPSNDTAHGPVTVVNGVVIAGSTAPSGPIYAMDARTGTIIWTFNTNATVYGGASVSFGCIYIGHGYSVSLARFHPTWNSGKYLFAFCVS